jgi:hypothetical protein
VDAEYKLARGLQPAFLNATLELIYPKNSSFTGTLENEESVLPSIGQIQIDNESARLIFVYPGEKNIIQDLCALIEGLGARAGAMGAHFLMAAVDESNPLHYALCQCSYRPLFSQKFWKIDLTRIDKSKSENRWQPSTTGDLIAIQSFLRACIPAAIQPLWQLKPHHYPDLLLYSKTGLSGMATLHRYAESLFIYPLILPDCTQPEQAVLALIHILRSLNLYMMIPSFQYWLEGAQSNLRATTVLKQSILIKYLVVHQKAATLVEKNLLIKEKIRKPTSPAASPMTREKY